MITKVGSLTVVVGALLVVGSVGALAGSGPSVVADGLPASTSTSVADTSTTTTTTATTTTATTTTIGPDTGDNTPTTVTSTITTTVTSTLHTVATTVPVPATVPISPSPAAIVEPAAGDVITTGAVLAVPIGQPATAAGATPARGTQVQLHTPPPPPAIPAAEMLPDNSGQGRRVVYSKTLQRVWAVDETGTVVKTHRVSGKLTPLDPAPGVYSVWSRSRNTCAIHNPSICWGYMVRFATGARGGNIGFHEIPYQYGQPVQTVDQLGEALSGGCVRQSTPDAIWMWDWAQLGTVVVVLA